MALPIEFPRQLFNYDVVKCWRFNFSKMLFSCANKTILKFDKLNQIVTFFSDIFFKCLVIFSSRKEYKTSYISSISTTPCTYTFSSACNSTCTSSLSCTHTAASCPMSNSRVQLSIGLCPSFDLCDLCSSS